MTGSVLTFNAGSSSVKFASFDIAPGQVPQRVLHGQVEGIGTAPRLLAWAHEGDALEESALPAAADGADPAGQAQPHDAVREHQAALAAILAWLAQHPTQGQPLAAAHRVVHGGVPFTQPTWITPEVLTQLDKLTPLAPLHQPHNLAAIRAIAGLQPGLRQLACFDTAFHAGQPWVMQALALPRHITEAGVKGYGFHGLSYEFIASQLPAHLGPAAEGRVVVAHLGNGASLCAMRGRQSVATTMGFSVLDGLMMGTRCGHLDPGVVLYLMADKGMSVAEVQALLYQRSGLLGVSGLTSDMRILQASAEPQARQAIDLYISRIGRALGAMAATIGGLDALVFTGGIGEHSALVRQRVCEQAAWLGIRLDVAANAAHGPRTSPRTSPRISPRISTADSPASAWVMATNEEQMLARHTQVALG